MRPSQRRAQRAAKAGGGDNRSRNSRGKGLLQDSRDPQGVMSPLERTAAKRRERCASAVSTSHGRTRLGVSRNPQAAMSSSGGEDDDSSSDKAGGESVALARASQNNNFTKPCLEGFSRGAWWDVQIKQWRSDMFLVAFKDLVDEEDAWVSIHNLRLQARRCTAWDCFNLKKGMDISVYDVHPEARNTTKALYDAKLCFVKKSNHHGSTCSCKFFIMFYAIEALRSLEFGVDRELMETSSLKGVSSSSLFMMQQPWMTPSRVLLKAHILESRDFEQGHRLTSDAYFLNESKKFTI